MKPTQEAYHQFQKHGGVADLSSRVKLALTGADRVRYLNGQVTSNVSKLGLLQSQPACVTTAKGRLCAEIRITAQADALLIDADLSLEEILAARLERYIVADDVVLSEMPAETRLLHFLGSDPRTLAALSHLPFSPANRFGIPGFDLWTTASDLAPSWQSIISQFPPLEDSLLELIRIEHGIPRWGQELNEETLPPEAGLDRTHIDYHKGCYIGQEVISRLKSVGHVNRQLVGFSSSAPLLPGMVLFSAQAPEKLLGSITSAGWSFALEKEVALGYLRRGASTDELFARPVESPNQAVPVTAQDLPLVP